MKRHAADSVSLVFGLFFLAVVTWWGLATVTDGGIHVPAAWIGAGTLLVIGVVGLVSALRPERTPAPAGDLRVDPLAPHDPLAGGAGADHDLAELGPLPSLPDLDILDAEAVAAAYREAGLHEHGSAPTPHPTTPLPVLSPDADPETAETPTRAEPGVGADAETGTGATDGPEAGDGPTAEVRRPGGPDAP